MRRSPRKQGREQEKENHLRDEEGKQLFTFQELSVLLDSKVSYPLNLSLSKFCHGNWQTG